MGNGWVLPANHGSQKTSFTVDDDQPYSLIANSGQQITGQDLYMFRVTVPESSLLDGLGQLTIVDRRPSIGTVSVQIGTGVGQISDSISATDWQEDGT